MKRITSLLLFTLLLAVLTYTVAFAAPGDIWLAGYHLLTLKTPTDTKALQQRVDAVQTRANELLELSNQVPKVEVRKAGGKVNIWAGKKVFLTVTAADARVNATTVDKLARRWAQRLRTILPEATPIKH